LGLTRLSSAVVQHLESSQQSLLTEVKKGKMTPEIDAQLKKTVQEHVASFVSA
jgi:F-type H+-transporting ATPase subunit alpha